MLCRTRLMIHVAPLRSLSTFRPLLNSPPSQNGAHSSPEEFKAQAEEKKREEDRFHQSILQGDVEYEPKYLSEDKVNPISRRPLPLNVELLKYKPLQVPKTHGHQVAKIEFKGFDRTELLRAAEFAARAAYYLNIPCSRIANLKTERRLYTVIRSPFAQAKSKENFQRRMFGLSLTAFDATSEVVDIWLSYINRHAIDGVQYNTTTSFRESLDFSERLDKLASTDMKLPESFKDIDDPIANRIEELLKSDTFKKLLDETPENH
ncbi:Piso0_002655 [Millerozyma farinosa CBS 7064]|uniref:Piso0_002655 protein n=1 Tax=Pichia sorbitophila (strain ATCC MYA-4447 / BCRC 22081 / CBS 7064 / NBRC 10061 / NRRL Y-12695) TaxID=559304 RepID=G8YD68_PICSO|nr:Piso0_002655 [Millerozyma farinosa CBS 7064]